MNRQTDNQHLLADVLADDAGFRAALFAETARLAGRRRRFRQARRAVLACAVIVGLAALVWRKPPARVVEGSVPQRSYDIVRSLPLPATAVVTTQPFAAVRMVASSGTVQFVQTVIGVGQFREISDDDLLALAPGPAALVRRGPHTAELIVLDAPDQEFSTPN